jgi:hypothetical protein
MCAQDRARLKRLAGVGEKNSANGKHIHVPDEVERAHPATSSPSCARAQTVVDARMEVALDDDTSLDENHEVRFAQGAQQKPVSPPSCTVLVLALCGRMRCSCGGGTDVSI